MMTTWAFLEAMMAYPDVQAKTQAEIGGLCKPPLPTLGSESFRERMSRSPAKMGRSGINPLLVMHNERSLALETTYELDVF